jgi:tetratricopeptide (TPR) repeat protein
VAQEAARIAAELPAPALSLEDRIWILNAWSRALSDLDRRTDALAVSREQVRLLRVQEAQQGGRPHPQLALSLVNLAIDLKQLGRGEEALSSVREGAARMRTLAEDDPALRSDLAAALVELSNCSSWLGRVEDALEQVQEARRIYAELDAESPGTFDSDRVMTLANEGGLWWRRGEHRRAVQLMRSAARLCRPMALAAPQQHGPMLATLLANLAGALADDDQPDASLAAVRESVSVHRALAERLPGAFTRGLALALNNLGGSLFEMDRFADALAAFDEAARALERAGVLGYEGASAELQSNRAACLLEQGSAAAALAPADEGVAQLRLEYAERPDATRSALARVLAVRGTARVRAGDAAAGLRDLEEALDLLTEALRRAPTALSELWEWVGDRYVEACAAAEVNPDARRLSSGMEAT